MDDSVNSRPEPPTLGQGHAEIFVRWCFYLSFGFMGSG